MKKRLNNVSAMALPMFYVSSAIKYVYQKGESNGRTPNKVQSSNR